MGEEEEDVEVSSDERSARRGLPREANNSEEGNQSGEEEEDSEDFYPVEDPRKRNRLSRQSFAPLEELNQDSSENSSLDREERQTENVARTSSRRPGAKKKTIDITPTNEGNSRERFEDSCKMS